VDEIPPQRMVNAPPPRVTAKMSTSISPTCPRTLQITPRIHLRQTRRNTPMTTVMEVVQPPTCIAPSPTPVPVPTQRVSSPTAPTRARQTQATVVSPIIRPCVQSPAGRKSSKTRQVNDQQIGSKRNSSATASQKCITSLIRTQIEIYRARPQDSTTAESRKEARVIEPQFT
jgi:hypothetical protein